MKPVITITARMKSQRLPLKVLRYIEGKPMIEHMINRLKQSKLAKDIILCTSTNPQDDILVDVAETKGISWFRGSEHDVLDRLLNAAIKANADFIASVTADNPLSDPGYIDRTISLFRETKADYITSRDLPFGTFSYGIKVKTLSEVVSKKKEEDTEIWGRFFEKNPAYKKMNMEVDAAVKHPEIRLSVDEEADLRLMREIFKRLYTPDKIFTLETVVEFLLVNPQLLELNKNVIQRTA